MRRLHVALSDHRNSASPHAPSEGAPPKHPSGGHANVLMLTVVFPASTTLRTDVSHTV